jgi:hypothetical protein
MPTDESQSEYELQYGAEGEGAEGEEDLDSLSLDRLSEAVVTGTDWTAETILRQLERGNINLDPLFQRRDAWRAERKSKFVESIILGLPVPQLVLAEDKHKRGSYIVIDGKQRLLSLRQFAAKKDDPDGYESLRLKGLEIRSDINGKTLQELEEDGNFEADVRAFQNQPIRTVVIKAWPNESILYLIFLRLNTGSVALSPQELRQALHPGPFVRYVDEASGKLAGLKDIFQTSKPDFRMRDAELLVRYFAFRNFLSEYRGNLKLFLDQTCKKLNETWTVGEAELKIQTADFESAVQATFEIFGEHAFRKWDRKRYETRFNRAVFDLMVFYFSDQTTRKRAIRLKGAVQVEFKRLCDSDQSFSRSISTTTKSLEATANRLIIWGHALKSRLGVAVSLPRLNNDRIEF